MNQTERMERSRAFTLGILAVICGAFFPAMLTCAIGLHFVLAWLPGLIGMLAFVASLPLAILAWCIGARDLRIQTAGGSPLPGHGGASRGVRLGKYVVALWFVLLLFAALTYTRPI